MQIWNKCEKGAQSCPESANPSFEQEPFKHIQIVWKHLFARMPAGQDRPSHSQPRNLGGTEQPMHCTSQLNCDTQVRGPCRWLPAKTPQRVARPKRKIPPQNKQEKLQKATACSATRSHDDLHNFDTTSRSRADQPAASTQTLRRSARLRKVQEHMSARRQSEAYSSHLRTHQHLLLPDPLTAHNVEKARESTRATTDDGNRSNHERE